MRFVGVAIALFSSTLTLAQDKQSFHGAVTNSSGAPIANAFVLLRDYQQIDQDHVSSTWQSRTDATGQFTFNVSDGCYDLFVSASLSLPFSGRVCIPTQGGTYQVKMKPDPHPRLKID